MGTESVPETSEHFYTLTCPSAREDFIEFCRRESFKTYIFILYPVNILPLRKHFFSKVYYHKLFQDIGLSITLVIVVMLSCHNNCYVHYVINTNSNTL